MGPRAWAAAAAGLRVWQYYRGLRDGLCPARGPPEAPGRAARYIALARRALGLAWSLQRKTPFLTGKCLLARRNHYEWVKGG